MPKLLILWLFEKKQKNGHCARSYSQFYGICRGRWIVFMTEPITLYHDFPAKGVPHIFWTIRLKCLLAQITVPWHFYGPIQFQDYTAGYFLTHERTIHLPQKYRTTVKLQQHIFSKGHTLSIGWFLLDPFHRRGRVLDRKFCLYVCLFVHLSIITFSFFEYSMIW